jgi:NADH-quinone oxidoreductase subunit K
MINSYIYLSIGLFCIGLIGALKGRNYLSIFMSIEISVISTIIISLSFARVLNNENGIYFCIFIMILNAIKFAIGLKILMNYYKDEKSIDTRLYIE